MFGTGKEIQTLRIVSDHLRASYALLHDGVFPSNVGRGYVLRRIIRRAIQHAQQLGVRGGSDGMLALIAVLDWVNDKAFQQMRAIITNEERAFEEVFRNGQCAIEKALSNARLTHKTLSGANVFRLYDTYGIPLELTQEFANEKGITVDVEGYKASMKNHKQQNSDGSIFAAQYTQPLDHTKLSLASLAAKLESTFVGYEHLNVLDARVLDSWSHSSSAKGKSTKFGLMLDRCPFYPEGGGQVGDRGHLVVTSGDKLQRVRIVVEGTKRLNERVIGLKCSLPQGMVYTDISALLFPVNGLAPTVEAYVDRKFRFGCAVHHTATHLLQCALKEKLGEHITQAGSHITSGRLRFDFAHFDALTVEKIASVEARVNEFAAAELDITTVELPREEAKRSGAICNFGDKYGDIVRVVRVGCGGVVDGSSIGISSEFCEGTHVHNVRDIFPFVIFSEGSVAAGTRRVEAVAGQASARYLQAKVETLQEAADQLSTTPGNVVKRIAKLQKQLKQLESRAQALGDVVATLPSTPLASGRIVSGSIISNWVELHALNIPGNEKLPKILKHRAEYLAKQAALDAVLLVLLGSQMVCIANKEANVHAGKLLQQVLMVLGCRGGGNVRFAQGSLPAEFDPQEIARLLFIKA